MAYTNCCNQSGCCGCNSIFGTGYARRVNASTRNSYSALNSVAMCTRCLNYPFYTGPCPDTNGCYCCGCNAGVTTQNSGNTSNCCDNCGCSCCDCNDCCGPVYGVFTASAPLNAGAGTLIPITAASDNSCGNSCGFSVSGGTITLQQSGAYLVTYTLRVPAQTAVNTTISLNLNGVAQTAASLNVVTSASNTDTSTHTAQTILCVSAGDTLSLSTSAALNITGTAGQPLVTLSLIKIDG